MYYSVRPHGLPFTCGDVPVYVFDINQPGLHTPFYSVLVSVSVFMTLATVFHSINSHSVLPVLFLPYWSFQLCLAKDSLSPDIILCR